MQITGANDVDIMLNEDGQPVSDGNGDTALVSDDEVNLQTGIFVEVVQLTPHF